MTLPEHGLEFIAGPRELIFVPTENAGGPMATANLIQAYISYRTLIAYNVVGAVTPPEPRPEERDPFRFTRLRLQTTIEGERVLYEGDTEETVEVSLDDVRTFLRIFNEPLSQALDHYLNVTDVRYILMEYHKAFEAIAESLGGTLASRKKLAPFGVTKSEQSDFSALCNDQARQPSVLSRHAPLPGGPVHQFDPQYAFRDARFMHDFALAATFCRKMIDGYVDYLVDATAAT